MIKTLALIRPKATGNPKVDKIFGQIRHVAGIVFSTLLSFGLLSKLGLDITPTSWAEFWAISEAALDTVYLAIGAIGQLIVQASSWYSKD